MEQILIKTQQLTFKCHATQNHANQLLSKVLLKTTAILTQSLLNLWKSIVQHHVVEVTKVAVCISVYFASMTEVCISVPISLKK